MYAAAAASTRSARFARDRSASIIARFTAAEESRSSQKATGNPAASARARPKS